MMCDETTASTERVAHGQRAAVHAGEAEARVTSGAAGVDHRLDAVVGTHDEPLGCSELRGLLADAAADVEHDARPETHRDLAVPRVMQREQRIGGRALHRTLAGEFCHTPPSNGAASVLVRVAVRADPSAGTGET